MHNNIQETDNPIFQYKGPIRALVILFRYQFILSEVYPNYFSSTELLSSRLLDILYNPLPDYANFRKDLIHHIHSINFINGKHLTEAFHYTNRLDDFQKFTSIRYLEYYKKQDRTFLNHLIRYIQAYCDDHAEILSWPYGLAENHLVVNQRLIDQLAQLEQIDIEIRYSQYIQIIYNKNHYDHHEKIATESLLISQNQNADRRYRHGYYW